jgi:uncharacterized protein (TIGR00290 family)
VGDIKGERNVGERILLAWSGGKDSALALHEIMRGGEFEVAALLTTITEGYDRVSMHGVREELLDQQADAVGLSLEKVRIPERASTEAYGAKMREALEKCLAQGVRRVAFGDVFLQDVRAYREENLAQVGMAGMFPLWGVNSKDLMRRFVDLGFRAVVTCVDTAALPREFAGREIDAQFVQDLPDSADPCGENGEYHTFVYAGPILRNPIRFRKGEVVLRENRFYYCELTSWRAAPRA